MNDYLRAITEGLWEAIIYVLLLLGISAAIAWGTIIVVFMLRLMEMI